MPPCAAFLRAVNLAGHNRIAMADLRRVCETSGLSNVRTLLQSGNVVFESDTDSADLEQQLESALRRTLALETHVMVRTQAALDSVVRHNPFPAEAKADPAHLVVVFLKTAAKAASVEALQARIKGREVVRGRGAHLYIVYPDGIGTSRLTGAAIDNAIATPGTGRNWNTVLKIRKAM
jgi:uncharacterized protein (DUF1697 family)